MFLTPDWDNHVICFRTFALAQTFKIQLNSPSTEMAIDSISVESVDVQDVHNWRMSVLSTMPAIIEPASINAQYLAKTKAIFRKGGKLRIVMLGDSTINDTGNSLYESSLHQILPNVEFEVINSVRGSTGCTWYQNDNNVNDFVLRFNPDLLIIGGISNGFDENAIRSVIKQVRKRQNPDILFLTDSITPKETIRQRFFDGNRSISEKAGDKVIKEYPKKLKAMLNEEKADLLDMRSYWNAYTKASSNPYDWFMRDVIHANTRGKQVVGQILLNYLKNI
jgi:lysophospholipase L1-like esterase